MSNALYINMSYKSFNEVFLLSFIRNILDMFQRSVYVNPFKKSLRYVMKKLYINVFEKSPRYVTKKFVY